MHEKPICSQVAPGPKRVTGAAYGGLDPPP